MTKEFAMSMMGELKFFLGFQVKQLRGGTFINQAKYIQDMLKRFDMVDAKPMKTPMPTNGQLDLDPNGKDVDQKVYRSMIGSLLYLCASRPDIMLSVCMCARFQSTPKESHYMAVKRILRYLVYTPNLGLWYPKGSSFKLVGYSDSDWAGDKVDRKSTSGSCQFLGRSLVSWSSKKQNCVSLSTAEAEYIAAGSCCAQLLWMRQTLMDYGVKLTKCLYYVTMKVQSRLRIIPCNIAEPSILIFVIIFFGIMWHEKTLRSFMWAPRTNLRILSRSHLMKQGSVS
jgi:hypothetical protein